MFLEPSSSTREDKQRPGADNEAHWTVKFTVAVFAPGDLADLAISILICYLGSSKLISTSIIPKSPNFKAHCVSILKSKIVGTIILVVLKPYIDLGSFGNLLLGLLIHEHSKSAFICHM